MENCRRGGDRDDGFRPDLYGHRNKSKRNNISYDRDSGTPEQIVRDDQSIFADVKSIPSSVFDLSLQNLR